MKKYISWCLFIGSLLIIWMLGSIYIDNVFILPSPIRVGNEMLSMCSTKVFYQSCLYTIVRVLYSIFISFVFGSICAFISSRYTFIQSIFSKLLLIVRSLPNVTIIILLLFWVSREMTVFLVSFLLLFPIVYENIFHSIEKIKNEWKDVLFIYKQPFLYQVKDVYLPMLGAAISSSLISAASLGFKVGIMAEILGQVQNGIGRQIQIARVNFELGRVMAWTIWVLVLVFIVDFCLRKILKGIFKS